MPTFTFATAHWLTSGKMIRKTIRKEINRLIGDAHTGVFVVTMHGPMGSDESEELLKLIQTSIPSKDKPQ